jgi:hypothetical protein
MTAAAPARRDEGIWSRCAHRWADSLPGMTDTDFDHEAGHVAYLQPDSPGRQFMRAAIDTERARRQAAGGAA